MGTYASYISFATAIIVLFLQHAWGVVQRPYETYRKLTSGVFLWQIAPIVLLCVVYFGWTTLIHIGLRSHPLLLTFNFVKLITAAAITFVLVVYSLVNVGRIFGGVGSVKTVVLPWAYSMLPTLTWFFVTSVLWIVFPPPRSESVEGRTLSAVYLVFSWFLFFWKGVLYYLTLRFGMRLDFAKIIGVSAIIFPLGFLYALLMYRAGVFRVPFI